MVLAVLRTSQGNAGEGVPVRAELRLGSLSPSTEQIRGPGGGSKSGTWRNLA